MPLMLRPLYEHWLLEATQAPLPAWKRRLLKRALGRDMALRCLAAELAEFSNEVHAPAADKAPDLRTRVVARALEPEPQRPLFPSAWMPAGGIAVLLLLALVAVFQQPAAQPSVTQSADNLNAPIFPTPFATSTAVVPPDGVPVNDVGVSHVLTGTNALAPANPTTAAPATATTTASASASAATTTASPATAVAAPSTAAPVSPSTASPDISATPSVAGPDAHP